MKAIYKSSIKLFGEFKSCFQFWEVFTFFSLGPVEIAFFLGLVLLLFGPDKVPQLAKSIGKATREYQRALKEVTDSGDNVIKDAKGNDTGISLSKSSTSSETAPVVDRETKIMQQAELLGINTNGKTIDQIVDEILSRDIE